MRASGSDASTAVHAGVTIGPVDPAQARPYVARMTMPPQEPDGQSADGCAELRSLVAGNCEEAHLAKAAQDAASDRVREVRRDLVAAQHQLGAAEGAADPVVRTAEKAKAREAYEQARREAQSDEALAEATATWARALDRANRGRRLAQRALSEAKAAVTALEAAMHAAELEEEASRIRAESAEAACLDARVRLAGCEEQAQAPIEMIQPTAAEPHAATGGHAVAIRESGVGEPLVIESMVSGDRRALELAAVQLTDHAGLEPAEAQLQLQELVDAILSSASEEGFLIFDQDHPFWSALTVEEARDVMGALARLGFQFEPAEGWHAGRVPGTMDLSMALAYAGLDARNMRDLPGADALRELPRSISVDARGFLAARAPDLAVDHIVQALDRRAGQLEPLWNEWGQVRPILLSERRSLGSLPG